MSNGYGLSAAALYGVQPQAPSGGFAKPTESMGFGVDDIADGWRALVDPRNPLLWFGVVLAVTLGAAGVSGSVKAGPIKGSASVGDTS